MPRDKQTPDSPPKKKKPAFVRSAAAKKAMAARRADPKALRATERLRKQGVVI